MDGDECDVHLACGADGVLDGEFRDVGFVGGGGGGSRVRVGGGG